MSYEAHARAGYPSSTVGSTRAQLGSSLGLQQRQQEPKRSEAEQLQKIRTSLAEADEISTRTLGKLDEQTEQLHRIKDDDLNAIDHNLNQSDHLLRGLKPMGWLKNMFKRDPTKKQAKAGLLAANASAASGPSQKGVQATPSLNGARHSANSSSTATTVSAAAGGAGAARLLANESARNKDNSSRPDKKGSEVDKAYAEIDDILEGLKHKSHVINHTLDVHNKMIPEISDAMEISQDRINKQNKEMKKIMGR